MLWYQEKGKDSDVAISTRIRLARNLKQFPFPNMITPEQRIQATKNISDAIFKRNSVLSDEFSEIHLDEISPVQRRIFAEQHLISPAMLVGEGSSFLRSKDDNISLMLMEEDHIRLQIIRSGMDLNYAWELADKIDSVIEESVEYAFDADLGYLTSCPTNTGTGLRASVMLHLPALTLTDNLSKFIESLTKLGITVRGLYGEGSEAHGNLFQFSNQVTMGATEIEIISRLENIVSQMIDRERETREHLKKYNYDTIADKVWRSYGILSHARTMSSQEAKSLLSDISMGQSMGIIPYDAMNTLELSIITEPAHIMQSVGQELSIAQRDLKRADILREKIQK